MFGPNGIEQFLKEKAFQSQFGARYTRDNLTDIIAKVIPEVDRKNKDRKVMQPLMTHYNDVEKRKKKKDSESHADALGKIQEILYVFVINPKTRVTGLRELLEKQGHKDLIEKTKSIYDVKIESYQDFLKEYTLVETVKEEINDLRDDINANQRELLEAILKTRKQELQDAKEEFNETVDELLSLIIGTPEKEYKDLINKIIDYLKNIKK